jgi:hypothetical protein
MTPPEIESLGITQDSFTMRWKARGYVEGIGWLEAWGESLVTALEALKALAAQRVAEREAGEARTSPRPPRPYSTEAAIRPNNLYLIGKKEVPVSPYSFLISQPISYSHRNRHFFATVEEITVPISIIFGTNGQGQTGKRKLGYVAAFLIRSGRSFRAVGPSRRHHAQHLTPGRLRPG